MTFTSPDSRICFVFSKFPSSEEVRSCFSIKSRLDTKCVMKIKYSPCMVIWKLTPLLFFNDPNHWTSLRRFCFGFILIRNAYSWCCQVFIQNTWSKTKQLPQLGANSSWNRFCSNSRIKLNWNYNCEVCYKRFVTIFDEIKLIDILQCNLEHIFRKHSDIRVLLLTVFFNLLINHPNLLLQMFFWSMSYQHRE